MAVATPFSQPLFVALWLTPPSHWQAQSPYTLLLGQIVLS